MFHQIKKLFVRFYEYFFLGERGDKASGRNEVNKGGKLSGNDVPAIAETITQQQSAAQIPKLELLDESELT